MVKINHDHLLNTEKLQDIHIPQYFLVFARLWYRGVDFCSTVINYSVSHGLEVNRFVLILCNLIGDRDCLMTAGKSGDDREISQS